MEKKPLERRTLVKALGAGAAVGALGLLAGCESKECAPQAATGAPMLNLNKTLEWKMVTTWPKNFPGLGTGANYLAELLEQMSGGRIKVKVFGAGELVPAFGTFEAVSKGTAELGHGAAYYWKGKSSAAQFFTAVPFGLNAQEMSAWINFGGAQQLWDDLYRPFGLKPFAAGNTGVQMGGWFNKEINTLADFSGLKMRMPGLGGEVLARLGGTPVSLPGGEIFQSLQSGAIDATEWVGPYNDLAFGFYKIAKYYYGPGWHEPGSEMECLVNLKTFEALPSDLKAVVSAAMRVARDQMLAEFTARNGQALETLITQHKVQLRQFSDQILTKLGQTAQAVVAEVAQQDPESQKIYDSFAKFRFEAAKWTRLGEQGFAQARQLTLS
ncbi:MAG: TRAP transporter substrate-binding protein [bacterium]|nr:TRAP transporter substrate-binding protein [bacterium]